MSPELSTRNPALFELLQEGNASRLKLSGDWTVHTLARLEDRLVKISPSLQSKVLVDLSPLSGLDTAGALLINTISNYLTNRDIRVEIFNENPQFASLLKTSQPVSPDKKEAPLPWALGCLYNLGKKTAEVIELSGMLLGFMGQFIARLFRNIFQPSNVRFTSLVFYMEQVGLRAIPIVAMLSFLIGLVVAYMGMAELSKFGAKVLAVKLVEVSIFRELGVIITSIVVAGRSSSSFAAQIGSMVSNEEVAALESMGLDPLDLLVMPRIVALIITLPMLVFVSDLMGILGGAVAICLDMGMSLEAYFIQVQNGAKLWNFLVGIIKAPFCALAIGLVGCYQGFKATGSAESVGYLTTISVVQSIFLVIVIDAIFAIFFTIFGI